LWRGLILVDLLELLDRAFNASEIGVVKILNQAGERFGIATTTMYVASVNGTSQGVQP
jgi:hypothetical protein